MDISGAEIAELVAKSAYDRKASDIVILDLKGISSITDYFVICTGNSDTHVQGIAEKIKEDLDERDVKLWNSEGERKATWILLDYIDVIVHIFTKETREFYSLERLWGDAPKTVYGDED